jgi:hypothetical protein
MHATTSQPDMFTIMFFQFRSLYPHQDSQLVTPV